MAFSGCNFSTTRKYIGGFLCGTLLTTVSTVPVVVIFMDNHDASRLPDMVIPGFIIFAMGFSVGFCCTNQVIRRICGPQHIAFSTSATAQESEVSTPFLDVTNNPMLTEPVIVDTNAKAEDLTA